jgi:hypothetical protein
MIMKRTSLILLCIFSAIVAHAQLCPGGGTDFSSAVLFDPAWISTCSTGTSGSGGTNFSNMSTCEPNTAIDPCPPTPSCGTASYMGSDIWYKFYATGITATISVTQNVSLVVGIQVFSGGPSCGSLTEIGCAVANGPSSGTSVVLSNLTKGALYYFRVFGNAKQVSQRTGLYTFCGSSGMSNYTLPIKLLSFIGNASDGKVLLNWKTTDQVGFGHFEVERSTDGTSFSVIGNQESSDANVIENSYSYEDYLLPRNGILFYRLKMVDLDGSFTYSPIVRVEIGVTMKFKAWINLGTELRVEVDHDTEVDVFNSLGTRLFGFQAKKGSNIFYDNFSIGVYILRRRDTGEALKLLVVK